MSSFSRPRPLLEEFSTGRPRCPVCGSPSYSADGIHPQCAALQWDRQRMALVKEAPPLPAQKPKRLVVKPWHRLCPRCGIQSHFRKPQCSCGEPLGSTADGK